jgi:hypothetical protein
LVPVERIELPTNGLQNRCSTAELNRHKDRLMKRLSIFRIERFGNSGALSPTRIRPVS